jgi:hypothetical protein
MTAIRHLKMVGPANVKRTVALPVRKPNAAYRSREHLTEREVERLCSPESRRADPRGTALLQGCRSGRQGGRARVLPELR